MVNLKNSIKNTNTLFFACYGKRVSKFYNELSNINLNDLYWTKISTKPLRFFKKFRKNTRFRMVIISIIRLILKLKGFIETIINNFFFFIPFWNHQWFQEKNQVFSGFNETFMVSDRYFGPKLAKNEVSRWNFIFSANVVIET